MIDGAFFDPKSSEFVENPYPFYESLRRHDPVHKSVHGFWILTGHQDILSALKDPMLGNEPSRFAVVNQCNRQKYVAADVANNIIPFMDPPRHTRPRKLIGQAFRARLDGFSPDMDELAASILDGSRTGGEIDLIGEFATPFSLAVICRFIGLPEKDAAVLKSWSDGFFYLFNPIPSPEVLDRVNHDLAAFRDYIAEIVAHRRNQACDDLISRLIAAHDGQPGLTDTEIVDTCMLVFSDGVENVDSGFGNCMLALLEHEDQMSLLTRQPELIENAIAECLRFNPPAQFIARIAREDHQFGGASFKKNQTILLALASANRDPDTFPDPDNLNINRENIHHLALGRGRHSCLGGALVVGEYQSAIRIVLSKLRDLQLKTSRQQWLHRMGHRWLDGLQVSFTPY